MLWYTVQAYLAHSWKHLATSSALPVAKHPSIHTERSLAPANSISCRRDNGECISAFKRACTQLEMLQKEKVIHASRSAQVAAHCIQKRAADQRTTAPRAKKVTSPCRPPLASTPNRRGTNHQPATSLRYRVATAAAEELAAVAGASSAVLWPSRPMRSPMRSRPTDDVPPADAASRAPSTPR